MIIIEGPRTETDIMDKEISKQIHDNFQKQSD
jgi:hypothetical protein